MVDRARIEAALPGYALGAEIGRGASEAEIAARHRRLGHDVTITVVSHVDDAARFEAEARVLADLEHPHIVGLYEYVARDGLFLLVFERPPGGSLGDARVTPEYACGLGLAIADALDTAHRRRVLHRDVGPQNLLFDADGAVKVAGFARLGSLAPGGPGTDVHALSVVLQGLLTAEVDGRVAAVVRRGLTRDADARQPTARSYALELAAAAASAFGGDWLTRAGLPVRVDEELRAAARSTVARPRGTTAGRRMPDWPWGPPPERLDDPLPEATVPTPSRDHPRAQRFPRLRRPLPPGASTEPPPGVRTASPPGAPTAPVPAAAEAAAAGPGRRGPAAAGPGLSGPDAAGFGVDGLASVWRGRAVAIGGALLGAVLTAVVVGVGVGTFATGPAVVPGPGGVAASGTTLYVSDPARSQVRRYDSAAPGDTAGTVVAGSGRDGYSGDGGPATRAALSEPGPLAADRHGNLYIADVGNRRIRKVTPDGRITTVVGGGTRPLRSRLRGTRVRLSEPFSIAVSPQGTLWIAEQQRNRVSRLRPDGIVETYVGTGQPGYGGDGLYASWALLNAPTAVALNPTGDRLYIADQGNRRIREVRVGSGFIRTIAGDGTLGPFRNNVQATTVGLPSIDTLTATPDGTLYLGGGDTRRIDPDGFVQPVAPVRTIALTQTARGTLYLVAEQRTAAGDRVHRLYRLTDTGRLARLPW